MMGSHYQLIKGAIVPEYVMTQDPILIATTIKFLAASVVVTGTALISVVVWQFQGLKTELAGLRTDIREVKETNDRDIQSVKQDVAKIERSVAHLTGEHDAITRRGGVHGITLPPSM